MDQVDFDLGMEKPYEERIHILDCAADLARSLFQRKAIPEVRLRYFTDPVLNVGSRGKSIKDMFERNGTRGQEILEHPHFLKYLWYFIHGPALPPGTIAAFRQLDPDWDRKEVSTLARAEACRIRRPRQDLREEFFQPALEGGFDNWDAMRVRQAVASVR